MKITFPHLGNTYIIVKSILDDLGTDYIIPPFNNKRALELGTRYTSEMVCLPLKINKAITFSSIEMGPDTILWQALADPGSLGLYAACSRNTE